MVFIMRLPIMSKYYWQKTRDVFILIYYTSGVKGEKCEKGVDCFVAIAPHDDDSIRGLLRAIESVQKAICRVIAKEERLKQSLDFLVFY